MSERQTGQIKKMVEAGFGFITADHQSGPDLFFHATQLGEGITFDSLNEGQAVSFTVEDAEKGPRAIGVTPL